MSHSERTLLHTTKNMKTEDLKTDIKILIDCILCQLDNSNAVERALRTLTEIVINDDEAQGVMREIGALKFVTNLMISTSQSHIRCVAMLCVAHSVFGNAFNQNEVGSGEMFSFLCQLLTEPVQTPRSLQPVLFLTLALVANSGTGQTLLRKSNCLTRLLQMIQEFMGKQRPDSWVVDLGTSTDDLIIGKALVAVITSCVNNPQNDENQRYCASVFPQAFRVIEEGREISVTVALASLIGQTAANNIHNQDRVQKCGGVEVLTSALHRAVNRGSKQDQRQLSLAVCLVANINTLISDHDLNAKQFGELGGIPLLLKLLQMEELPHADRLQVVLTLGHCTYNSVRNQEIFVAYEGLTLLIQQLPNSEDEQLSKAIRFVLKACAKADCGSAHRKPQSGSDADVFNNCGSKRELDQSLADNGDTVQVTQEALQSPDGVQHYDKEGPLSIFHRAPRVLNGSNGSLHNTTKEKNCTDISTPPVTPLIKKPLCDRNKMNQDSQVSLHAELEEVKSRVNSTESEQLKEELKEERQERRRLESEVEQIKSVLEDRTRQEAEAGRKADLLLEELERQHRDEQQADTELEKRVEESLKQYEELSRQKQEKEDELQTIEEQLVDLKSFAEQSGIDLTIPLINSSFSQVLANSSQIQLQNDKHHLNSTLPKKNVDLDNITRYSSSRNLNMKNTSADKADFVFVRPRTPVAQDQMRKSITCPHSVSGQRQNPPCTSFITKPKGQGDHHESHDSLRPASPCMSEFDLELLKVAKSHHCPVKWTTPKPIQRLPPHMSSTPLMKVNYSQQYRTPTLSIKKRSHVNSVLGGFPDTPCVVRVSRKRDSCQGIDKIRKNLCETEFLKNKVNSCKVEKLTTDWDARISLPKTEAEIGDYRIRIPRKVPQQSLSATAQCKERKVQCEERKVQCEERKAQCEERKAQCEERKKPCPVCNPPEMAALPVLHSRSYNIALETNPYTCLLHREIRKAERKFISELKNYGTNAQKSHYNKRNEKKANSDDTRTQQMDVYDFHSCTTPSENTTLISPPGSQNSSTGENILSVTMDSLKFRRERIPYTRQEEHNLTHGVHQLGKFWKQILNTYDFHTSRTAVDLKDKYRKMEQKELLQSPTLGEKAATNVKNSKKCPPFSMAEERRLRRGVRMYGNNWLAVLAHFKFSKRRTASSLRDKWRNMHK